LLGPCSGGSEILDAHVYSTSFTVPPGFLLAGKTYFAVIASIGASSFDALDAPLLRIGTPIYTAPAVTASFQP